MAGRCLLGWLVIVLALCGCSQEPPSGQGDAIGSVIDPPPASAEGQEMARAAAAQVADDAREHELLEARREIELLRDELEQVQAELVWQRETIREHSLTHPERGVDAMLGLFPAPFPTGRWEWSELDFEDCWFESADGLRLHGWLLNHPDPRAVVLFAHGNAGNVTHRMEVAAYLWERFDVAILVFDYRGYGRSEGIPTLDGLLMDARAARQFLARRTQVRSEEIVLLGRSLGGAVAAQLAAETPPRGLILESTFTSLREAAATHYPAFLVNSLVKDRYDTQLVLPQLHCPILISHGDLDQTIPVMHAHRLHEVANEPKTLLTFPEGDHNSQQPDFYWDAMERFLDSLPE
ncbi:MAG: alpha/beta hydrolase [Planctomycetales bacterium]|nr:alpha/beta hydrolase [Planctomycetales bacterium]